MNRVFVWVKDNGTIVALFGCTILLMVTYIVYDRYFRTATVSTSVVVTEDSSDTLQEDRNDLGRADPDTPLPPSTLYREEREMEVRVRMRELDDGMSSVRDQAYERGYELRGIPRLTAEDLQGMADESIRRLDARLEANRERVGHALSRSGRDRPRETREIIERRWFVP